MNDVLTYYRILLALRPGCCYSVADFLTSLIGAVTATIASILLKHVVNLEIKNISDFEAEKWDDVKSFCKKNQYFVFCKSMALVFRQSISDLFSYSSPLLWIHAPLLIDAGKGPQSFCLLSS